MPYISENGKIIVWSEMASGEPQYLNIDFEWSHT